jgi:hypothetical protein
MGEAAAAGGVRDPRVLPWRLTWTRTATDASAGAHNQEKRRQWRVIADLDGTVNYWSLHLIQII